MIVYLDQDGVLADFDKALLDNHGIKNCRVAYSTPWKEKTKDQIDLGSSIVSVMKQPGFFQNLPPMEGMMELWKSVPDPHILTALPGFEDDNRVTKEKRNWVDLHIGQVPDHRLITCLRSEKAKYATFFSGRVGDMTVFSNILVDDAEINCIEWEKAGGIAILFTNYKQAIKELNNILKRVDVV